MKSKTLFLLCCMGIVFLFVYGYAQPSGVIKNNPPKVEILMPENAGTFAWNSFVRYSIKVTDAEDGNSEYEEIPSKEIFMEITWLPGNSKQNETGFLKSAAGIDPPGMTVMKTSSCFNCHTMKAKLTGPSFFEISKKYAHTSAMIAKLANKVIKGSSGVWSNTAMLPNHDLTLEQSKAAIQWIFKNAENPDRNYYVGVEGSFKTRSRPANGRGSYIFTASYTDHGLKGIPKSNQRGYHTIVIQSR